NRYGSRRIRRLFLALWATLGVVPGPFAQAATSGVGAAHTELATTVLDLYLSVTLNGNPVEQILPFVLQDGALWARPSVLHTLGFKGQEGQSGLVRLETLPDVGVHYDEAMQSLDIQAPLALM